MKDRPIKNIFVQGAITPQMVADSIATHQTKAGVGGHDIFLGQVRADVIGDKTVKAIEFSAQEEMANAVCHEIREESFEKFDLNCMHILHSLGRVEVGELCIFVFVSSGHRKQVFEALPHLVDELKARLPIFGKEIFEDESHQWKVNK